MDLSRKEKKLIRTKICSKRRKALNKLLKYTIEQIWEYQSETQSSDSLTMLGNLIDDIAKDFLDGWSNNPDLLPNDIAKTILSKKREIENKYI